MEIAEIPTVTPVSDPAAMLKELGEPLVKAAFDDILSSNIPSPKAREILVEFSQSWKDYSRPALMMLVCEAVGGNPKTVEPVAKAMILSAGAFDIHDDIIDRSYERGEKREKTLLSRYGLEAMLLIGDALLIGSYSYLPSMQSMIPHEKIMRIASCIQNGLFELGSAELDEMNLIRNFKTTPEEYLRVVQMKAADVESYTKVGAMVGCTDEEKISAFAKFGRLLGIITILRDDIEDTFNDKFELSSRITKESLPLPIIFALKNPKMLPILQTYNTSPSDETLEKILEIVEESKGFEKTKDIIETYIFEVKNILQKYDYIEKLTSLFT
jgi:heptaprenyl diphosphate synthase